MKINSFKFLQIYFTLTLSLCIPLSALAESGFLKNLLKLNEKIENFKGKRDKFNEKIEQLNKEIKVTVNNIEQRNIKDIALDFEGNLAVFSIGESFDISGLSPEEYKVWDIKSNRIIDSVSFGFSINYANFKNENEVIAFNYSRDHRSSQYGIFNFLEKKATSFNFSKIEHSHSTGGLLSAIPDDVCGIKYMFFVAGSNAKYVCENDQSQNKNLKLPRDIDKIDDATIAAIKSSNNPFQYLQKLLLTGLNYQHHVMGNKYSKISVSMARNAPTLAFLDDEINVSIYSLLDGSIQKKINIKPLEVIPEDSTHEKINRRVSLSPDGKKLAVTSFFAIHIYSIDNGNIEQTIPVFRGLPSAITWSGNSKRLGVGYKNGGISVYNYNSENPDNNKNIATTEVLQPNIYDAFAYNTKAGIYGARDKQGNLNIWNIKTHKLIKSIPVPLGSFMDAKINDEGTHFLLFRRVLEEEEGNKNDFFKNITKKHTPPLIIVNLQSGKIKELTAQNTKLEYIAGVEFLNKENLVALVKALEIKIINIETDEVVQKHSFGDRCLGATNAKIWPEKQTLIISCINGELLRYSLKYEKMTVVGGDLNLPDNVFDITKSSDEDHAIVHTLHNIFRIDIDQGILKSEIPIYGTQSIISLKDGQDLITVDQVKAKAILRSGENIQLLSMFNSNGARLVLVNNELWAVTFNYNKKPSLSEIIKINYNNSSNNWIDTSREISHLNSSYLDKYNSLAFSRNGGFLTRRNGSFSMKALLSNGQAEFSPNPKNWKLGVNRAIDFYSPTDTARAVNDQSDDGIETVILDDRTDTVRYFKFGNGNVYGSINNQDNVNWNYKIERFNQFDLKKSDPASCTNNGITDEFIILYCKRSENSDFFDIIEIKNGKSKGKILLSNSEIVHSETPFDSFQNKIYTIVGHKHSGQKSVGNNYVLEIDLEKMKTKRIDIIESRNTSALNISIHEKNGTAIVYNHNGSFMISIDLITYQKKIVKFPFYDEPNDKDHSDNGTLNPNLCWLSENEFIFFQIDYLLKGSKFRYLNLTTSATWESKVPWGGFSLSTAYGGRCKSVANLKDSKLFAISDEITNVYFKNINTGETVLTMSFSPFEQSWVIFSPDGFFDISNHTILEKFSIAIGKGAIQLEKIYDHFYRPDIINSILNGNYEYANKEITAGSIDKAFANPGPIITDLKITPAQANSTNVKISYKVTDQGGGIGEIIILNNGKVVRNEGIYKDALKVKARAITKQTQLRKGNKKLGTELAINTNPSASENAQTESVKSKLIESKEILDSIEIPTIPGEVNEITIIARNKTNTFFGPKATISYTSPLPKREPHLWLLSVGIGKFSDGRINQLASPKKDAIDFSCNYAGKIALNKAGIECTKTGFASSAYKSENIHVLTPLIDKDADRNNILAKLDEIAKVAHPSDTFIWFVSSHGTIDESGVYGIAPYDLKCLDNGCTKSKGLVSANDILERSKSIKATKQILILDTCQAGGLDNKFSGLYDARVSALAKNVGLHIFAAATAIESALDGSSANQNSVFTTALLEGMEAGALTDTNLDGRISAIELGKFVKKQTPEISKRVWKNLQFQSPVFRHFGKDIVLSETR